MTQRRPRGSRATTKAAATRLSVRAFAGTIKVSHTAVQKAIRSGRLRKSIGHDARGAFILDAALGKREWAAGASKPANGGGRGHALVAGPAPRPAAGGRLVDAQLRLTGERAVALELANRRKRGEVVEAATVERDQFQIARMVRERILNVPARLQDMDPGMRARLVAELRQALSILADELDHG